MSLTRRQILRLLPGPAAALGALAAPGSLTGWLRGLSRDPGGRGSRHPQLSMHASRLKPFVDSLPVPPVATPERPGHYRMVMQAAECQLHRDLGPTSCWTFNGHLPGPTIEARSHEPISVEWVNHLPSKHFLPIDYSLFGETRDLPEVRAVVHMHGARVPASSDGYPTEWTVPGQSRTFHYPNGQDAATLYYHDHTMGINRLNIYAGLFGLMLIRDAVEESLHLPGGEYEIPLEMADRLLTPEGQLYYPVSTIPGRVWVPEVFGNLVLINGKFFPDLRVEPRAYRFRVLNTANDRFFYLSFSNRQVFHAVGSDQGLLDAPVPLREMLLAPAERSDWVVDFSRHRGETLYLINQSVQQILRIRVASSAAAPPWRPPARLRPIARIPASRAARTRPLTLDEYDNFTAFPMLMLCDGKYWHAPVSETPRLGSTEIWSFINTTPDTHSMHLHLVRFQVLDRQDYDWNQWLQNRTLRFLGPPEPPAPEERGWKDTVRVPHGTITRILVTFEPFAGRYVWHCHLLDHEDNQMMRPYEIVR